MNFTLQMMGDLTHNYFMRCNRNTVFHAWKVGCNIVQYETAFLYSDWSYFLWHGIKVIFVHCAEKNKAIL